MTLYCPGKAKLFQDGNPLIYGGAVKEILGSPGMCDEVVVKVCSYLIDEMMPQCTNEITSLTSQQVGPKVEIYQIVRHLSDEGPCSCV